MNGEVQSSLLSKSGFGWICMWIPQPVSGGRGSKFRKQAPSKWGRSCKNQLAGEGWSGEGRRGENEEQGTIWQANEFHALDEEIVRDLTGQWGPCSRRRNCAAEWNDCRLAMNLGSEVVRNWGGSARVEGFSLQRWSTHRKRKVHTYFWSLSGCKRLSHRKVCMICRSSDSFVSTAGACGRIQNGYSYVHTCSFGGATLSWGTSEVYHWKILDE